MDDRILWQQLGDFQAALRRAEAPEEERAKIALYQMHPEADMYDKDYFVRGWLKAFWGDSRDSYNQDVAIRSSYDAWHIQMWLDAYDSYKAIGTGDGHTRTGTLA